MKGLRTGWLVASAVFALGVEAAADPLGTAGRFRSFGWANCGAPIMQQMQGACDPPAVSGALPAAGRAQAHLERAIALVSFLRMPEAQAAVGEAIKADPRNLDALIFRARLSMSQMQADMAVRDVNAGLLIAPDNPYLLATRAELRLELGQPRPALHDVSAALERLPDDVDMLWIRARVRMALDQLKEAESDLDRALQREPDEPRVRLFKAQVQLRRGNFQGAVDSASVLLVRRSGDTSALEVRAFAHVALGRYQNAIEDFNEILGKPGDPIASRPVLPHFNQLLIQRAILFSRLVRPDEARQDVETALALGGKQAVLRFQLHLRQNGFPDLPVTGQRSSEMDEALQSCFRNPACGRGLVQSL